MTASLASAYTIVSNQAAARTRLSADCRANPERQGTPGGDQLLTWHHSVIVNDIKGDLFTQTAGLRSLLGPVYVLDPTGVGHRYDPLQSKATEDALYSSAAHLLH